MDDNYIWAIGSGAFSSPSVHSIEINLSRNNIIWLDDSSFNYSLAKTVAIYLNSRKDKEGPLLNLIFPFKLPSATSITLNLSATAVIAIAKNTFQFPKATNISIDLSSDFLFEIPVDSFNYPKRSSFSLFLSSNKITSVAPGSLQGINFSWI